MELSKWFQRTNGLGVCGRRPVEWGLVHGILGGVKTLHVCLLEARCNVVAEGLRPSVPLCHLEGARRRARTLEVDGRVVGADVDEKVCKVYVLGAHETELPRKIVLPPMRKGSA